MQNMSILFYLIRIFSSNILEDDIKFLNTLIKKENVTIYEGRYKNEMVAIKVFNDKYTENCLLRVAGEIIISSLFSHPNIIDFKGFYFQISKEACLVYELGEKTISDCCFDDFESIKKAIKDILLGVKHMHSKNILHNDLKPDNIIKVGNSYKIIDFGSACFYDPNKIYDFYFHKHKVYLHVAPEVKRNESLSLNSDVYSIGIILKSILIKMVETMGYTVFDKSYYMLKGFTFLLRIAECKMLSF